MHIMKVLCRTLFDCTFTGVTGHLRPQQLPFTTKTGLTIDTPEQWNRSRNQQRNWETILQCISLKTQPIEVSEPNCFSKDEINVWQFSFQIEQLGIFDDGNDPLGLLKQDVHGVPMIVGLSETYQEGFLMPYMLATGDNANIFFKLIQDVSDTDF